MSKKKGKTGPKRPTVLIAIALVLIVTNAATIYYFTFFQPSIPLEDVPHYIGDVMEDPTTVIGKVVTIAGYYVIAAGYHILVTDPLIFLNNSLEPLNHVRVTGEPPVDMKEYLGIQCNVKGRAEWVNESRGILGVRYSQYTPQGSEAIIHGIYEDKVLDTSVLESLDLPEISPIVQKYAVLYSGGWLEEKAYYRYWNDLVYMYFILQLHGYPADNIYVVYKDGVGYNTSMPIDYPATQTAMETVFQELNQTLTSRDTLFFYTTNHGGSSGLTTYWPNGGDEYLNTTEIAGWLDSITCHHMIVIMQQCFSWKFIPALSAPNRVIMTACSPNKIAYGCDTEGQWDEFSYHFMSALIGTQLPGGIGDAWADFVVEDGKISMREAYLYAAIHDSWDETPMYDDDGDGVGSWAGPVFFGSGPFYGDNIFL
ncbi:MAG: C13 family peptidase [Candidatus Thorarchaeota archaeon]